MFRLILSLCIFVAFHGHAMTIEECASAYDSCKKDIKNLFDKKPCRKARDACNAQVAESKRAEMKDTMLSESQDSMMQDSMLKDDSRMTEHQKRELARRRLEARRRQQEQPTSQPLFSGSASTSISSGTQEKNADARKAEALRRLKARQNAKAKEKNNSTIK